MYEALITFLSVADLDRSTDFYTGALRMTLTLDQGRCRIFRAGEGAYVGVCDTRPAEPSSVIVTLVTDDVDGIHERLLEAGATVDLAPRHNPDFGIYQLFARDPDGYVIEIQRFDDPKWAG